MYVDPRGDLSWLLGLGGKMVVGILCLSRESVIWDLGLGGGGTI